MENKYYYRVEIKTFTTDNSYNEYKIFSTENAATDFVRKNKSQKLYYTQGWYATGRIEKILFEDYRYMKESNLEQLCNAQTSKTAGKLYGLLTNIIGSRTHSVIVQVSFNKEELEKAAQYLRKTGYWWASPPEVVEITQTECEWHWPREER